VPSHNESIPAINPSQYGPLMMNLTYFLPKLGQPLRWPYFVAAFTDLILGLKVRETNAQGLVRRIKDWVKT
jgi:hypothetical protein